jgi:uncharacterized damage-inducible protein DinB
MAGELDQLRETLDRLRATVLAKLAGLSEEEARRSTVGSGTNLAGLVQHLTFVEALWFEKVLGGRAPTRGVRSMQVDDAVSLRTLRSDYRAACATSNEIVDALGGPDAPVIRNGRERDLRWVMLAVIEETARHAGHADIIREQVDGRTGR